MAAPTNSWANMSEDADAFDFHSDDDASFGCQSTSTSCCSQGEKMLVEIALTASVESSLCRRGRRRFRELQASSAAKIRFDRARAVLKVSGTDAEIVAVRRKLECLGGVRRVVPTAVWCELMRTRLEEDPDQSKLMWMQKESGCRIHIERSLQEVRLFGPDENTTRGLELIEEFSKTCSEASLPLEETQTVPEEVVKAITDAQQVTVNVEKRQVTVYGLTTAVARAITDVETFLKTGSMPEHDIAAVDTDDESDDGTSSSSSSSVATWCDGTAHREEELVEEPCPPAQQPQLQQQSPVVTLATQPPPSSMNAAMPSAAFPPTACYMPIMGQPMVAGTSSVGGGMPMYQAVFVPAGMVLAPVAFPPAAYPPQTLQSR